MNKRKITILISLFFLVSVALLTGYFIYHFYSAKNNSKQNLSAEQIKNDNYKKIRKQHAEEIRTAYNNQFPDVVDGVINIISDKITNIKLKNGTEYLISPARPMSFYRDSGIENNSQVEIRGKILENGNMSLGSIIPAK